MLMDAWSGTVPRRDTAALVERRGDECGALELDGGRWTALRMAGVADWLPGKVGFPWLEPLARPSTREWTLSPLAALRLSSIVLFLLIAFQSHSLSVPRVLSQRALQPAPMPS